MPRRSQTTQGRPLPGPPIQAATGAIIRQTAVLLLVLVAVTGCARTSTQQNLTSTGIEVAEPSELQACAAVCLVRLQSCTDADAGGECDAENARCEHSCEHAQGGRVYAFYCQAEIIARRGLVLSDSSCTGAAGETLDEQRSGCERGFEPPPGALAYTVACRPVLTWGNGSASAARGGSSPPAQSGP